MKKAGEILFGGAWVYLPRASRSLRLLLSLVIVQAVHSALGQTPGTLDPGFPQGTGPDGDVHVVSVQSDGKILLGGNFFSINGVARGGVARFNTNGTLDANFLNGIAGIDSGWANATLPLSGGKVLVGGAFEVFNGIGRTNLVRLNTNGTVDTSFPNTTNVSKGADGEVLAIVLQPADEKVLIAGAFNAVHGVSHPGLARLYPDGSLDPSFQNILPAFSTVNCLALQGDGKVLIAGFFATLGSPSRTNLARLNADGSLDTNFNARLDSAPFIRALALSGDGRVLIGGAFSSVNGSYRGNVARLNADGTLDNTFLNGLGGVYDTQGGYSEVDVIAAQANGLMLIGGMFDGVNNSVRNGITRLNPDGSLDTSFDVGTGIGSFSAIHALALQPDEKVVLGGNFQTYNDVPRNNLVRINAGTLQYPMCEELPLPIGRTKAQLVAINPVTCNPPGGALWDPVNKMLLPATNGSLTITWSFTNDTVVTVLAIQALPVNAYDLGQELTPPSCASTNLDPDPIYGVFWHKYKRRMYVTAPGQTTIIWKRPNGPSFTFPQQVVGQWPNNQSQFQLQVANTPAVDLTGGGAYNYSTLLSQESAAAVSNNRFQAAAAGRSLVLLSPGGNPDATNIYFQLVQTILWNDPNYFRDTNVAVIGEPITDAGHDPSAGSQWVFDYLSPSYPWRFCADTSFYLRNARTGPIIPVNRSASGTRADDLLLINYQAGARVRDPLTGNSISSLIYWPYQPVRYLSVWPTNPETIFVAGGQGSGPVMLSDGSWSVYRQPVTNLYGYNPNEEHAFRFPGLAPSLRLKVDASVVLVTEGDSLPVRVSLTGDPGFAPQSPVTVTISEARDGDPNLTIAFPTNASGQQLVFSPTNWQTPQTITLVAGTSLASGSNSFVFQATGGLFSESTVQAVIADTNQLSLVADTLAFEITEAASRGVHVRLSKPPLSNVTVVTTNRANPGDSQRLRVESGGTLVFNAANWNIPQTVTLHADSDADFGNDTAVFNLLATGGLTATLSLMVTQADTTLAPDAVYALRNDLGDTFGTLAPHTSEPYVLLKHAIVPGQGRMKVYKVLAEDATHRFQSSQKAGQLLQPPYPLTTLPKCPETVAVSGPYFRDRNTDYWAKSAGISNGLPVAANIVLHYFYHPFATAGATGFDPPLGGSPYSGTECLPWLDNYGGTPTVPINYNFVITWPDGVPELRLGETLVKPKFGLPNIANQCSVDVIYEQSGAGSLVQLYEPLALRVLPVNNLVGNKLPPEILTQIDPADQKLIFMKAPLTLRKRLKFNPNTIPPRLEFGGYYDESSAGEPLLLPDVMTVAEANTLKALSANPNYRTAIDALRLLTIQSVAGVSSLGSQFKALSANSALNSGYVSIAMQNSTDCGSLPVSVEIIKVTCPLYQGGIKAIYADCPFDELLTLRHTADFAGAGDNYTFDWFYRRTGSTAWIQDPTQTNQDLTIQGPGLKTLEDYEYYCHYRPLSGGTPCGIGFSPDTVPQLAEGWIKRVLRGVNPFTQITADFHSTVVDTTANAIQQAGHRWEGSIALNCLPGNQFGLIEAYETVLRRGIDLSIGAGLPLTDDTSLRLAAGQLCDLYLLLGNEAYADAQDPTIGFGTEGGQFTATSTHCFQGQVGSLLEEELALLRGRDGSFGTNTSPGTRVDLAPVYNRLYWNFGPDIAGQTAYVLNYSVTEKNATPPVNAADAQFMFPQGHGDAWGHYLSAIMSYYDLFSNPNYTWVPEMEDININGADVQVNFQHERKFAKVAAARARSGAEIVGLTYRSYYSEDPAQQWQGYQDANTNRAWGVSEWASRAGQAAFFDWAVGNTLLPDKDLVNQPPVKVDRTTVSELREVAASFVEIQQAVDGADQGLNPLGLDKNVVPFGIDPGALTSGQTHFDQIHARAISAMNNAIAVFNHANEPTQLLRKQQDTLADFQRNVVDRRSDFNNRLIEIFGYPYNEDIGGAGAYPVGYAGPDLYHFAYVDVRQLAGVTPPTAQTITLNLQDMAVQDNGSLATVTHPVNFNFASDNLQLVKPANFTSRLAPGELQRGLGELLQTKIRFEQALTAYDNLLTQIEDQSNLIRAQYSFNAAEITVLNRTTQTQRSLNDLIKEDRKAQMEFRTKAQVAKLIGDSMAEFLPLSVGFSVDATSTVRGALRLVGAVAAEVNSESADERSLVELDHQQAKEDASNASNTELTTIRQAQGLFAQLAPLEQLIRQEAVQRYEIYNLREAVTQAGGNYLATLARGNRLLEDRLRFLQETATQVQAYRYKDMAFRIFRNDALQKYRAQFDVAARYVYLAAKAYDYETGLLQTSSKAGSAFLEDIVKKRAIGNIQNGVPLPGTTGDSGLAATMAAMSQNYATIKANLGLNNQITRQRLFSLRNGWFRIANAATNAAVWQQTLRRHVVGNIWDLPEFQRYCRPLRAQPLNGREPAIVISFPSEIVAENNFFGWPAGGGDSGYNASLYSTKILSMGIWLSSYDSSANGLVQYPSAWLVPVGEDVVRAAGANDFSYRRWKVYDQKIPVPNDFLGSPPNYGLNWIPIVHSLNGEFGAVGGARQYNSVDATTESQGIPLDTTHLQTDSGLIGRSAWNTQWLLIIPGVSLLGSNPDEGLERFIAGALVGGQRTGIGVTDIKIYFTTYSYSGF